MEQQPHHFTIHQKYIGFLFLATILFISLVTFLSLQRIQNEAALNTVSNAQGRASMYGGSQGEGQGQSQQGTSTRSTSQSASQSSTTGGCYQPCGQVRRCSTGLTCQDFPIGAGFISLCVGPNPYDSTCHVDPTPTVDPACGKSYDQCNAAGKEYLGACSTIMCPSGDVCFNKGSSLRDKIKYCPNQFCAKAPNSECKNYPECTLWQCENGNNQPLVFCSSKPEGNVYGYGPNCKVLP